MSLRTFLARELEPSHRRIVEALRTATKATLTTGLAASMQVVGPFGPLFAFRIGQPGISLGLFEGAVTIICAAAMQAAIVPITGKLLDYPGLMLAFLFSVFATIAYLLSNTRLFLMLALVAIGAISTIYVAIFEPGRIGWGSTYTFDGILIATLVMVCVDTFIWPSPSERRLLEFVAADLARSRRRFEVVGQRYLDPFSAPLTAQSVTSTLAPKLALLKTVEEHMKPTARRLAVLVDAIMNAEQVYLEVEDLAVLAEEPFSEHLRQEYGKELESSLNILHTALTVEIERVLGGLPDVESPARWISDLRATITRLSELSTQTRPSTAESASEALNYLGFVGGLETIANLLDPEAKLSGQSGAEGTRTEDAITPARLIDPARLRFSFKLGAAITLGLLVGLTTQRADLQTILWSIAVAGQPNQYGAVVRKTILRLTGCILGGVAALAAMLLVSQNFDSLPPYLIAIFAVTALSAYVSQSSDWLGYAGIQAGITFLICYVGLAPSSDVYRPLWRFWGIVLGVLTTGFVYLFLLPEYASDKVIENLANLTETTLGFAKEVAEKRTTQERFASVARRLSTNLLEVLNMADQARLEGRLGAINSAAAVEAAALLIRIAYRFEGIARARMAGSEVDLPLDVRERWAAQEQDYCAQLESGVGKLKSAGHFKQATIEGSTAIGPEHTKDQPASRRTPHEKESSELLRANLAAQLQAYRRLPTLLSQFDTALSKIGGER